MRNNNQVVSSSLEKEIKRALNLLVSDFSTHVDLYKITKNRFHKGIFVDFWVEELNLIIEAHGIQHYKVSTFGGAHDIAVGNLIKQQNRDDKLRNICRRAKINFIEVKYDEFDYTQFIVEVLKYRK